jgi:selenocysteine-specific elongation factor
VLIDGAWFDTSSLGTLVPRLAELVHSRPDGVTISEVRDALGGTRRTLVPFLTWCDEQGLTRRRGDVRIAGPRLPA